MDGPDSAEARADVTAAVAALGRTSACCATDEAGTECLLFSDDALPAELFGAFSSDSNLSLGGVAPDQLLITQSFAAGGCHGQPAVLWNPAVALARAWYAPCHAEALGLPTALFGKRILELGAGLGVCALTVAALGAREVVATETEPALHALRASIARNSHSRSHDRISVTELTWGVGAEGAALGSIRFDAVMGTDLLYAPSLHAPLLATLGRVVTPNATTLILAYETRGGEEAFFEAAERELGVVGEHHVLDGRNGLNDDMDDDRFSQSRIFVGKRIA